MQTPHCIQKSFLFVALLAAPFFVTACDEEAAPEAEEDALVSADGVEREFRSAPLPGSCDPDDCGGQSADGCYCDEWCTRYGDCCDDKPQICGPSADSCYERCDTQAPAGCYCDDVCEAAGDCCPDYAQWCEDDPNTFACGDALSCTVGSDFCEIEIPGIQGQPTTYECKPNTSLCNDCSCLAASEGWPASFCSGTGSTGLTITIPLP